MLQMVPRRAFAIAQSICVRTRVDDMPNDAYIRWSAQMIREHNVTTVQMVSGIGNKCIYVSTVPIQMNLHIDRQICQRLSRTHLQML